MIVLHTPSMVSVGIVAILAFSFRLSLADRFSRNPAAPFKSTTSRWTSRRECCAKARERARSEAEQRAFRLLMERITLRVDWPRLPVPNRDDIAAYIRISPCRKRKPPRCVTLPTLVSGLNPRISERC